jgi:diguanylate cyclase (GGDEF)-like protein
LAEDGVEKAEFDRLVAEARNMRFEPEQEKQFEAKTGPERSRLIITRGVVGLMLYLAYLAIDYLLTPDSFILALVLRAGLVVPLTVISLAIIARNPTPRARDGLAALVCVAAAAATLVITLASADSLRQLQLHSFVLMAIFIAVTLNLRIAIAAMSIGALGILHLLGVLLMPEMEPGAAVAGLAIFAASGALSLSAAQNFERNMRMAYLFGHSQRQRTNKLENLSRHDPLTGLGNRRALDEMLESFASGDAPKEIAVIVADIDHFKSYNDALGHLAGDQCLKRVAGIIASELRGPADRAVRFGGEEFLVLLPDADLWTAIAIAERIRAAIETAAMPNPGRPFNAVVTASLGFAAGRLERGAGADELIRSADAALYAAKNAGRNQVWPRLRRASELAVAPVRASGAA